MARLSTRTAGKQSKQNYGTPMPLIDSLVNRYGKQIVFDLAAEPENKKHERYFAAPRILVAPARKGDEWRTCETCGSKMVFRGEGESAGFYHDDIGLKACTDLLDKDLDDDAKVWIPNPDTGAYAFDALAQSWHEIPGIEGGILWLNPPFSDIEPWVEKCKIEGRLLPVGTSIMFLVPAAVGADWFLRHVFGVGDRNYLKNRVPFNGSPYNKDCMIVEFHQNMNGRCFVWDWKRNKVYDESGGEPAVAA